MCGKYAAEWECLGVSQDLCEETFESCTDKDLRLADDAYGCLFDSGVFACDGTPMTSTEELDAVQECGEEMGAFLENVSDDCAGY